MLPVSAISDAANKLRSILLDKIDDLEDIKRIKIGHPKDTFENMQKDMNNLNLFFYNVKYDGYPADGLSDDPFYVRLYCLITAVGAKKESSVISSGENDLRLIGEVMRVLHQHSIFSVDNGDRVETARIQIIPHTLELDNLNHIWSTQGEIAYRLSVAYEMSLAPIPLAVATPSVPIAGDPQVLSWGAMKRSGDQQKVGVISFKPGVEYLEVDTEREGWIPHISFVEQLADSQQELQYVFKVEGDLSNQLGILIAGKENEKLKLVWNVWRRKKDHSVVAWKENIADSVEPTEKLIDNNPPSSELFFANRIDPQNIDSRRIVKAQLPADVRLSDTSTWQAVLYAVYEWEHEEPADSGNSVTTAIKSNSLLFFGAGV